jgi:hypothetical protein
VIREIPKLPEATHRPGQKVTIGDGIPATIEEVIYARGMTSPFYLVEYWHEGHLISRRVHAEDCR